MDLTPFGNKLFICIYIYMYIYIYQVGTVCGGFTKCSMLGYSRALYAYLESTESATVGFTLSAFFRRVLAGSIALHGAAGF